MFKNFKEFLIEPKNSIDESINSYEGMSGEDFSKSPFLNVESDKLFMKTNKGDYKKGDLNTTGRIAHFIYKNQGLSARQIKNKLLGKPENTPEGDTYRSGGRTIDQQLDAALLSGYVIRSNERPGRYYAKTDLSMTIDDIKAKHKGSIAAKRLGL